MFNIKLEKLINEFENGKISIKKHKLQELGV